MCIKIKNWLKFQHFKDRNPPWIKLYKDILDDPDWHELNPKDAKILVMIWLIASEDETKSGMLPKNKKLAFRLRIKESELNQCIDNLHNWLIHDDITAISERYQVDAPETEGETYKEEGEGDIKAVQEKSARPRKIEIPFSQIVSKFNEKVGTDYKPNTKETMQHISARFAEGFSLSDFFDVIDHMVDRWKDDPKMSAFLRPKTIFGSKFESYLQSSKLVAKMATSQTMILPDLEAIKEQKRIEKELKSCSPTLQ